MFQNFLLSEHFNLKEFLTCEIATRYKITQQYKPPDIVLHNLKNLCKLVLEPIYSIDNGIIILSGYRHKLVNDIYKGHYESEHMLGLGVDIFSKKIPNGKLFSEIIKNRKNIPFHNLIWEYGDNVNPDWIHVSYNSFYKQNIKTFVTKY